MQLSSLALSKNSLFYLYLIVSYVFGVIFYDCLPFSFTDELLALVLLLFAAQMAYERRSLSHLRPLLVVGGILVFYVAYSLLIASNTPSAILKDFVIQLKPFIGFFGAYIVAPQLNGRQKHILSVLCLAMGAFILIIGVSGLTYVFFGHPSRLATAAVATALLLLYCSDFSWSDIAAFILLLSIGFLSTRSKFYGFWLVAVLLLVYLKSGLRMRFNFTTLALGCLLLGGAVWMAYDKIVIYYVDGMMNSREMWSRPAMMLASARILGDYFPLGSGLASFGTFASAEQYSSIYAQYGLDKLWGLSKDNPVFVCDAFYPELAQFGVVGVGLYILFWFLFLRRTPALLRQGDLKGYYLAWCVFLFFLIEGIADATFTHNRGFFVLTLAGMVLGQVKPLTGERRPA